MQQMFIFLGYCYFKGADLKMVPRELVLILPEMDNWILIIN